MTKSRKDDKRTSLVNKTFKNASGAWELYQKPNLPIAVWFVAMVAAYPLKGRPELLFTAISKGALFTWAWLEIFQGVNYFRRALGLIVMFYLLWSAVTSRLFL